MTAAFKKRRSLPRDFIPLVFSKENMTLSDCIPVYEELERNPRSISRIFSDKEVTSQLYTHFDQYASRIARFFIIFNKNSVNRSYTGARRTSWVGVELAHELVEHILIPLLGDGFRKFRLRPPFMEVFGAVLDYCLPHNPQSLEKLARNLVEEPPAFAALISGNTSGIMKQWIGLFMNTVSDYQVVNGWTKRLIEQCDSCDRNHDIEKLKRRWLALNKLLPRLVTVLRNPLGRVPDAPRQQLKLDLDLTTELQTLGLTPPVSERDLETIIQKLEKDEIVRTLQAISGTFPCQQCYESSISTCSVVLAGQKERDTMSSRLGFVRFTDLLGAEVGIWRVLISSQALEDMQQTFTEGSFDMVESTLIQLSSGKWDEPLILQPVGEGGSFLYVASYGEHKRSGILWQLDVEYDESYQSWLQLIKVWRIGENKTIEQAEAHIRCIHNTYSGVRLRAHKHLPIDQASGIAYPRTYEKDSDQWSRPSKLDEKSEKQLAESLLRFNKFYTVTHLTFKNIRAENLTAEYPLCLAEEELEIVKETRASTLIQGRSGTGKTTCLVYKLFGRYVSSKTAGTTNLPRQVLLTRSHVLSHKLKGYTKRLIATHDPTTSSISQSSGDSNSLILDDDEREVNHTIFTILAEDFPLVCTFNYFIKLLENTLRAAERKEFSFIAIQSGPKKDVHTRNVGKGTRRKLFRRSQVVDFEVFSEQYWPTFPKKLTTISSTLAFMEIIGVIKGSACRSIDFKPLTRDEYISEGYRISPIEVDRNHVYDIYLRYEQIKREHGDLDDIDRARDILNGISKNREIKGRIESAFDEIYVDEVQDQRLLELMMLLHLIKAPSAINFAGDTAQSISKDSVFRFQNVKDLLYARFSTSHNTLPDIRKLYKNYRTHQEILNLATSVMRLLYDSFPSMVDDMDDEKGQFTGPKPVIFIGFGSDILSSSMFGATNLDADPAQFGADQVIIVRDDAQKEKLHRKIGDFALILTILESKGMEFEDVLLFDFFSTSECIQALRAALRVNSNEFAPTKHMELCSELKQLYVAITRCQNKLWFFESRPASVDPILQLWASNVHRVHINDSNASEMLMQLRPGQNANVEIWLQRGYQFIENKNYDSALLCFRRANDKRGSSLARGLITERKAKALLARGSDEMSEQYFQEAITLFDECGQTLRKAACYEALGDFNKAGDIFAENSEFLRAANLFSQANLFEKAAKNFVLAGRYDDGASILAKGSKFDSLVLYINEYSMYLSPGYQRHYTRLCVLLLKRGKISSNLRELAASTLNDDEKEEFFREYEIPDLLSTLFIQQGRYSEACRLAIAHGDIFKAWHLGERYGCMQLLPQNERVEVYSCWQVKLLHDNLSSETANLFISEPTWAPKCSWLSDVPSLTSFWSSLPRQLSQLWSHQISYGELVSRETWMKIMFDLIVTLKASAFIDSAHSIMELPVESINAAVRLTKGLIIDSNTPVPLLNILGILPCRENRNSLVVLQSSLVEVDNSGLSIKKKRICLERAISQWMVTNLCRAIDELNEKARQLLHDTEPCYSVQYRGFCRKPIGQCELSHTRMGAAENLAMTKHILHIASIFCSLLPLYYRKFDTLAPEAFLKSYRPRQRSWLERLLLRITYISSVEQAPEALMMIKNEIVRRNSVHVGVYGGLAQLLFFRLKNNDELDKIRDMSSMLEQLQVAQSLGLRPNFERSLDLKVTRNAVAEESWKLLQKISASLHVGLGQQSVTALDTIIQNVDCLDLHSYHAIIALYEKWATYLIYMSNPGDIILPQGWVEMYDQMLPETPQRLDIARRSRHRETLLLLIQSFCSLIQKVNSDERFQHKVSGRIRAKRQGIIIFARRNIHFLTTCVLNTYSWPTAPGTGLNIRCSQARSLVDETLTLRFSMSTDLRGCTSHVDLGHKYLSSFNIYNGKDRPRIVKATQRGPSFFYFLEPAVSRLLLEDRRFKTAEKEITLDENPTTDEFLEHYGHVEPAVTKIQLMWKSQYPLILKRREFFNSPIGKGICFIRKFCQDMVDFSHLGKMESLRVRYVLFSEGVQLHLFSERVDRIYTESRDEAQRIMKNGGVELIESAYVKWEKLLEIQQKVAKNTSFFVKENWTRLEITSQDLELRIGEVNKSLQRIEFSLNLLNPRKREPASAIVIQRAWRRKRQLLKLRRDYRNSVSGETIAYVQRIVKALNTRSPLSRTGEIRRAGVLFGDVVQLIQEVKRIEKLYKRTKHAVKLRMDLTGGIGGEQGTCGLGTKLSDIRDTVRKQAAFLSEANWMQLNVPASELEEKCVETWRVMRAMENTLFHIMYPLQTVF